MIGVSLYRTEWIRAENLEFMSFPKYEDNYWGGLIEYSLHSYYAISDCLYYYRILDDSNSHQRNDENHFARLQVELEKLKYYMQKGFFQTYYKEIVREIYPDYLNYCKERANYFCPIVTIAFDFTLETWEQYKMAYIEWIARGNSQEIIKFFTPLIKYLKIEN